jgi:hypothetical protein
MKCNNNKGEVLAERLEQIREFALQFVSLQCGASVNATPLWCNRGIGIGGSNIGEGIRISVGAAFNPFSNGECRSAACGCRN